MKFISEKNTHDKSVKILLMENKGSRFISSTFRYSKFKSFKSKVPIIEAWFSLGLDLPLIFDLGLYMDLYIFISSV